MKKLLYLLIIPLLFIACSSDDNDSSIKLKGTTWVSDELNMGGAPLYAIDFMKNDTCVLYGFETYTVYYLWHYEYSHPNIFIVRDGVKPLSSGYIKNNMMYIPVKDYTIKLKKIQDIDD